MKASDFSRNSVCASALVSTNSICQGQQVPILWPLIYGTGNDIFFAHTSFKWNNLANHNAGVTVVIVGFTAMEIKRKRLIEEVEGRIVNEAISTKISPYLIKGESVFVEKRTTQISPQLPSVIRGSIPVDGGGLFLNYSESRIGKSQGLDSCIKLCLGTSEFVGGKLKYCLWLDDNNRRDWNDSAFVVERLKIVYNMRIKSSKPATKLASKYPERFFEKRQEGCEQVIAIAAISSENRAYLPVGLLPKGSIISGKMYGIFDEPLWNLAIIASRLHWVWIGTVCVRMRTDFSYSNTLGWNTFPVPKLTTQDKADLSRCAENILLARERYYPATIAHMYDPKRMDEAFPEVRRAHEANDETLERIYIGRRFKNDTERLEVLFKMYEKMVGEEAKN